MRELLNGLIKYKENDLMMDYEDGRVSNIDIDNFTNLIIALVKLDYDIRYCTNKQCSCSPESSVKYNFKQLEHILGTIERPLEYIPIKKLIDIINSI